MPVCYPRYMDWTDVIGSVVGGLAGAAIPGYFSWRGVRDERKKMRQDRWAGQDGPVVADVLTLLSDVDPARRTISVGSDPSAEQALWDGIQQQRQKVSTELLVMRTSHPSDAVRACAKKLEGQVVNAVVQTLWLVKDQMGGREGGQRALATQSHQSAMETAHELERLVIEYGSGQAR